MGVHTNAIHAWSCHDVASCHSVVYGHPFGGRINVPLSPSYTMSAQTNVLRKINHINVNQYNQYVLVYNAVSRNAFQLHVL